MEPGDADVIQSIDLISHQLPGYRRFFGDRQVGGTGGGDDDRPATPRCRAGIHGDAAGQLVVPCSRHGGEDGLIGLPIGPCDEQAVAGGNQTAGDGGDLIGTFALSEHHFGESLTRRSVLIDPCKTKIFVRSLAQKLKELLVGSVRCQIAAVDIVEEGS